MAIDEELADLKISYKLNRTELGRWKNYSWAHDGDLAEHQNFYTALQKQAHLEKVLDELKNRIDQLEKDRREIIQMTDKFTGLNQKILKMKYIDGLTLEVIANELGYSYQYIKNKHAELMRIIHFDRS